MKIQAFKTGILIAIKITLLTLLISSCNNNKNDSPAPAPVQPRPRPSIGGVVEGRITGSIPGRSNLNEAFRYDQYYYPSDGSYYLDSTISPAQWQFNIYRTDTTTGSQIFLRFRLRSLTDTSAVNGSQGALIIYRNPEPPLFVDTFEYRGNVVASQFSFLQLRYNNLSFSSNPQSIRGTFRFTPVVNGTSGSEVSGSFQIPMILN